MRENQKNMRGITLITVVIILLMILLGLTIRLTIVENGILNKQEAKQKETETSAREKLESVLTIANIEKETNVNYNKEEFLNALLEYNDIMVEEDTIILDNYIFLIDREKLEIVESLGETDIRFEFEDFEESEYLGIDENGKVLVSILVTIQSDTNIQSVVFEDSKGEKFEIIADTTIVAKDLTVEEEQTYTITATTIDGKIEKRKIVRGKVVKNIILTPEKEELREGETLKIEATVEASDAKNKKIKWSSSDKTKATVDENGNVTPVAGTEGGTVTITAASTDGGRISGISTIYVFGNLEVLEYMRFKEITDIADFGFSKNSSSGIEHEYWNNREDLWFGAGASSGKNYWDYDVRLNPNEITALVNPIEHMKVIFYAKAYRSSWGDTSKFMGKIGVYYTDGTSNVTQSAQTTVGSQYAYGELPLELDIDSSKTIDYFQFYLWRI